MIPYNTEMKKMVMPEYGRLVHQMVSICVEMPDKNERTEFAAAIVEVMKSVLQEKGKSEDDKKYWDHLYIISEGALDVDSPYGTRTEADMQPVPEKVPYSGADFNRRHYGRILQRMVKDVAGMENGEEKDMYVELIANQIKKLLSVNNPEAANDEKVFSDLAEMSGGSIIVGSDVFDLPDFKEEKGNKVQKRKKNR